MQNPIEKLKEYLINNNLKISVSESLTSGLLQDQLAGVSGISACFEGGVTAYSLDQKVNLLRVNKEHAASVNCVSEQVALEMATGTHLLFGTDIALSTTGYAEPYPQEGVTDPYAWICAYVKGEAYTFKVTYKQCFPDLDPATDPLCREKMRSFTSAMVIGLLMNVLGIDDDMKGNKEFFSEMTSKQVH